jgi:hypothetical protein
MFMMGQVLQFRKMNGEIADVAGDGMATVAPRAGCTLKHHSLDPNDGHGMVQQQMVRCHGWKGHQFWHGFDACPTACQTFPNHSPKHSMG